MVLVASCLSAASATRGASWEESVTPLVPGAFSAPRPLHARYNFGWSGFAAATGDFCFKKLGDGRFQLEARGGTIGLVRVLWKYDIRQTSLSDARTSLPISVKEVEKLRSKEVATDLTYTPGGVSSARQEKKNGTLTTKTRSFEFPNVLSINSAVLFLRAQPLVDRAVYRLVVYPSTSAYLCTVTVLGRERIAVPTGSYEAFKLSLQLSKIDEKRELIPHKKFRNATVWLSNDDDRLILRVEAQVFVGNVFAELQSVQFEGPRP